MSQRLFSEWFVTRWTCTDVRRPNSCVVNGTNRCFVSRWGCWQASRNQRIWALSPGARIWKGFRQYWLETLYCFHSCFITGPSYCHL